MSLRKAASAIALTVAMFGTSTAFADEEGAAPKGEAAKTTESAKTESAKTQPAASAKKAEPPKDAPKSDAKTDAPKKADKSSDTPKAEAKAEAPKAEAAKAEAPETSHKADGAAEAALPVRASKPLTLAPQSEGTPWTYKLFAFVVIAGGIAFWVKKRKKVDSASSKKTTRLDIVARSSVGVRSELIVVEVDGTRLLVGMTPSAISTLAVLDSGDPLMAHADDDRPTEPAPRPTKLEVRSEPPAAYVASTVTDRVKTLLGTQPMPAKREKPRTTPTTALTTTRALARATRTPVAAQAKGLLLALEEDGAIDR